MKTYVAKPSTIKRDWFVIDATDLTLGRVATEIARRLRGKHKPEYTPFMDTGDYIIVINASKIKPEQVLETAVRGMLPKGPLGRAMFRKLKVYAGEQHNHAAQQPQELKL